MSKTSRRLFAATVALIASLAVTAVACGGGSSKSATPTSVASAAPNTLVSTPAAFPLTLNRSDGKQLTLTKPPTRIVSLSPGATEIIYALGAESALAAIDKNANYPDAADKFPQKVDAYEPNVEAIAGMSPDLVIVASDSSGLVPKLDELKIPVLYNDLDTDVRTIQDVLGQIHVLGQVTGTDAKAQSLIAGLQARVAKVQQAVDTPPADPPVVYHELDSTYFSVSNNTFIGDLYRKLHATNIAGDGGGVTYPQLTQETIIATNPTTIVLADEAFGVSIESVRSRPGWAAIPAVKNNRIYAINADIISRPGPRLVDALEQLARDLYPERFP